MGESTSEAKPKRRWYQFHLWHLFVLVAVLAALMGWYRTALNRVAIQDEAAAKIDELGGGIGWKRHGPVWLRRLLGYDTLHFLDTVETVNVTSRSSFHPASTITDEDLVVLASFPDLEYLQLRRDWFSVGDYPTVEITDTGLRHLRDLVQLRELDLAGTDITDRGLLHLEPLKNLRVLNLRRTFRVSDDRVTRLQQALPDCKIER